MRRIWKDQRGEGFMGLLFLIIILISIASLLYALYTVYANYEKAQDTVTRCASVVLDRNTLNANLRDVVITVDEHSVRAGFEQNLRDEGWSYDNGWELRRNNKLICRMTEYSMNIQSASLHIRASVWIPLPWETGGHASVEIPLDAYSRVLFIN